MQPVRRRNVRLRGVPASEMTQPHTGFTDRELARAVALQAADAELRDVPIDEIAASLADEIPATAYWDPPA
jgi:hypothetical protein